MSRRFIAARANQLQIDIDSHSSLKRMWNGIRIMLELGHVGIHKVKVQPSKTPGHAHATITLWRNLEISERIALQAILGSDPVRELMNWGRMKNNARHPILFLESEP